MNNLDISYICPHCGKRTQPIIFRRIDGTMESEPSCKFCGSKTPQNIIDKMMRDEYRIYGSVY